MYIEPKQIGEVEISGVTYPIIEVHGLFGDGDPAWGKIDSSKGIIHIESDMSEVFKRRTIWHEILHGILFSAGYSDHPENIIKALSIGLDQIIHGNKLRMIE